MSPNESKWVQIIYIDLPFPSDAKALELAASESQDILIWISEQSGHSIGQCHLKISWGKQKFIERQTMSSI